jgi:hexosaminidase
MKNIFSSSGICRRLTALKRKRALLLFFFAMGVVFSVMASSEIPEKSSDQGIAIIPKPANLLRKEGFFRLTSKTVFSVSSSESRKVAAFFAEKIKKSSGLPFRITEKSVVRNSIQLLIDCHLNTGEEGYTLEASKNGVVIKAKTPGGLFYGMQTFMQLLPPQMENTVLISGIDWKVPCVSICDMPRFKYRGIMLDVCRHFLPVESIKKQLETLSLFKINTFHWHLTDDQGWRIELKKYPRLTEIGSKRIEDDGSEYGGFYTQKQIKDIIAFAAERFITVIPEIEMPGHSMAAIASYPSLACFSKDYKVRNSWGVEQDVYCAGKEETFRFIDDVIAEVAALFPGEYIHVGGDECPKDRWKKCPLCQKRIKDEGLQNEQELQSYFMHRVQKMVASHGKKMIGWDEILEGGLAPSATVMSWRGDKGGIDAALMDHEAIMTPYDGGMYLDYYQGDPKVEPMALGGYITLEKTYSYEPYPKDLPVDKQHYIIGAQCNVWAECIYDTRILEDRIYPRILALSELTWTPADQKNYKDFEHRIDVALERLDEHHIHYYIPQPEQPGGSCNFIAFTDSVLLEFTTTRPVKMVYTLDGTEPSGNSKEYRFPLSVKKSGTLKIRSVLPSGKMSKTRVITVEKERLAPVVSVNNLRPGLQMNYMEGHFLRLRELPVAPDWKEKTITSLTQLKDPMTIDSTGKITQFAAVARGYMMIPEDGVYFFSSAYETIRIDGKLFIDNEGTIKIVSQNDRSIALAKGPHELEVTFLKHIVGGWPSDWHNGNLWIRKSDAKEFKPVAPEMLYY